ncbi:MAG: hypothetical protein JO327_10850, partial [Nitrososphaeraceae archaeon]|nr:hypothetical protein [Nitrososphaeraceae archaeon]
MGKATSPTSRSHSFYPYPHPTLVGDEAILIPGASGPAGINTIKSLKMVRFGGKI